MASRKHRPPPVETIIANVGVVPYPIPKGRTDKFKGLQFKDDNYHWMIATMAFDAQRKLLHLQRAALPILDRADPEFRQRMQRESKDIADEPDWENRAKKAHELMIKLQGELDDLQRGEPALAGRP